MFDEKSYVPAANNYLSGGGLLNAEHPPLGKWIIATGIYFFGDNAIGWRIFSVLFGVAAIFIFYLICVQLCLKEDQEDKAGNHSSAPKQQQQWFNINTFVPVFATFLFAFENLSFVQANIGMLDVFYVTFMLLGFLFYMRGNYVSSGIAMGLSMLCKTMALLGIIAILLHWAFTRRKEITAEIKYFWRRLAGKQGPFRSRAFLDIGKLVIVVIVMWLILMPLLEYPASHQLGNPFSRTMYMLKFAANFNPNHFRQSAVINKPWTWAISPVFFDYSLQPVFLAAISWNVWLLIILSMIYLTYHVIKYHKSPHNIVQFVLAWFFSVYLLLIPLNLISGRTMFIYYFYPAVPAVCLAIAWSVWKLRLIMQKDAGHRVISRCVLALYLVITFATFFLMSPFGGHFLFK